jgi:putative sigma-54 modulation protein
VYNRNDQGSCVGGNPKKGGLLMKIVVTFKNIKSSDYLKSYTDEKLNRLDKLIDSIATADVTLRSEKLRKIVEIHLVGDHLEVYVTEAHESMRAAIDLSVDKVRSQITKAKEKLRARRTHQRKQAEQRADLYG